MNNICKQQIITAFVNYSMQKPNKNFVIFKLSFVEF